MAGLQLTITNAGRNALVNAQNTGSAAVVVTQIGVSATHYAGSLTTLTAIPAEVKRLATFGGSVVADDTFHLSIRDESPDIYSLRLFGLYLGDGSLFAVYSQAGVILEKSAAAIMLLAVDVVLTALGTTALTFGSTEFLNPPATTTVQGVVELATPAETIAGADAVRAVTPLGLWQAFSTWAAGFAAAIHNHDASAIISGVLQVGRIPALGMEKITGLAGALVLKANLIDPNFSGNVSLPPTTLFRREGGAEGGQLILERPDTSAINGNIIIDSAVNSIRFLEANGSNRGVYIDLVGAPAGGNGQIWHSGNFNPADKAAAIHSHDWAQVTGKPNVAIQYADARFADVHVNRGDGSGIVYFAGSVTAYFQHSGGAFFLNGGPLWAGTVNSNGSPVWTSGNFNPADKAAAIHSHDWAQVTGKPSWVDPAADTLVTGYKRFVASDRAITNATVDGGHGAIEITGTANGAAFMSFHRPGIFAGTLGLDTDNQWKVGGWSMGAVAYRLWHEGNFNPGSKSDVGHGHGIGDVAGLAAALTPATAAQYRSASADHPAYPSSAFAAAAIVDVAQAATITLDLNGGLNFATTMTGNRTLGAPNNAKPGQSGVFEIVQDAAGGRTLAFNAAWKFANGAVPTLSTAPNARDVLVFTAIAADRIVASVMKDVR